MTRVLVTGGAGFIGSNLCAALRARGDDVTAFDNLSVSDANVAYLESLGVTLVRGDITDYDALMHAMSGHTQVYHLAAMNRAQRSIEAPRTAHEINATGTLNVFDYICFGNAYAAGCQ